MHRLLVLALLALAGLPTIAAVSCVLPANTVVATATDATNFLARGCSVIYGNVDVTCSAGYHMNT